jgi:GT2 family glycosyltransferase
MQQRVRLRVHAESEPPCDYSPLDDDRSDIRREPAFCKLIGCAPTRAPVGVTAGRAIEIRPCDACERFGNEASARIVAGKSILVHPADRMNHKYPEPKQFADIGALGVEEAIASSKVVAPPRCTSVVIPTRGPSEHLRELLLSLAESLPPSAPVEVILVHDGFGASADLLGLSEPFTHRVIITETGSRRGPGAARNLGVNLACGERIAFLDDDVVVPIDWYHMLDQAWGADPHPGLIGARLESFVADNIVSQAFEMFVIRNDFRRGRWFLASACLVVERESFRRLSGFDEHLSTSGEDWDLCRRAHDLGISVNQVHQIRVRHRNPTRLRDALSRSRSYAKSFGVTKPLSPADATRPLALGPLRLPSWTSATRPWIRAARALVLSMPLEFAARVRIALTSDLAWQRRIGVVVVHLPWFVSYWVTGVAGELRRNRDALRLPPHYRP